MRFTCWYNGTRAEERRGRLWGDRFKSVLLQGKGCSALWSCIKYVELNPVRAKIVGDPAEYEFSSWGRYARTGRHPFAKGFLVHARNVLGEHFRDAPDAALFRELGADMTRIVAGEAGMRSEDVQAAFESARGGDGPRPWVATVRRVRFWTDGGAIGDRAFVQECHGQVGDPATSPNHRYGRGADPSGDVLYAVRRLQVRV